MSTSIHDAIEIRRIADALGAEIRGVDLTRGLDDDLFSRIHDALLEHHVIFFRDQDLTVEHHASFARRFGKLHVHPFAPTVEGHPEIIVLENDAANPPRTNHWHADATFMDRPHMGAVLVAREVPESGGDTLWANMHAAYDRLPARLQRRLSGLTAVHDAAARSGNLWVSPGDAEKVRDVKKSLPPVTHPVVRTHPVTGRKSLFVNPTFTSRIVEMGAEESESTLRELFEHATSLDLQCRFGWRKHSIAVWDNRCTIHYAEADYWPRRRVMHRATITG